jgi:SAM-dependent methyltransferase
MDKRRAARIYEEYVIAPDLERRALLQAIRARLGGSPTVLYPGCSVHITPSFYFQHVAYVDRSEMFQEFFANETSVIEVVSDRRKYRQKPFIHPVVADFTKPLPFPKASFDVLLSLFAGGISRTCVGYLKPGGLLLSDDHHGDAREASELSDVELMATVEVRREKVRMVEDIPAGTIPDTARDLGSHRRSGADYYLFRKLRNPPRR